MLVEVPSSNKSAQHLPIGSLKLFGTNAYDEPMFRVVWSESRYYLVGANHTDYDSSAGGYSDDKVVNQYGKDPNVVRREVGYRWLPLYPGVKAWVLERWLSPIQFTGCTLEQYNQQFMDHRTGLLTIGPYPSRGEFVQCLTFPSTPTVTVVHEAIGRVRAGWNHSYAEHRTANQQELEKKQKSVDAVREAVFLDSQQAFKNRPSSVRPSKRTRDQVKIRLSADDLGMKQRGFFAK